MSSKNQPDVRIKERTFKEKTSIWFNDKFMPGMSKFASQKHLVTIRDSFGILTPIIIGGSIAFLFGILIFGAGGNTQTSLLGLIAKATNNIVEQTDPETGAVTWILLGAYKEVSLIGEKIFQTIFDYSMGLFSLMIVVIMGWIYAAKRDLKEPVFVAVLNLVCFMICAVVWKDRGERFNYFFDSKGMLAAILLTFLVIEIFKVISTNKKLLIKMPAQVPPMVATGFSLLIPVFLTLLIVSTVNTGAWAIGNYTHWDITNSKGAVDIAGGEYGLVGLFFKAVSAPFAAILGQASVGLGFGILYQFLVGFFWFFGLNGSSVVNGAFYPFLLQMLVNNAQLVSEMGYNAAAASGGMNVISIQFLENYSQTTGWGHTGALLLAIMIFGKVKEHKEVAKLAAVPAIFQINEPVTFGLPLMLHPVLGVGSMLAMPITTLVAWIAVGPLGIVRYSYIMVPWTLPPGVGALLSTGLDWRALVLAWFCLVIVFAWYIPFVLIANKYHTALNVQTYISQGLTPQEAKAKVKQDLKDYQDELVAKKAAKKAERKKLRSLPPAERQQLKLVKKGQKQEAKSEEKLIKLTMKENKKIRTLDSVKIVAEVVEYGGYKIKVDGKTFATAMNDQKLDKMSRSLAKAHNASFYTVVDKDKTFLKKVALEE